MDDADLASRFASGDADSVRVIYQSHGRLVFSIAYKVLGDVGLAEDATQQTFVQAWRAADQLRPGTAAGQPGSRRSRNGSPSTSIGASAGTAVSTTSTPRTTRHSSRCRRPRSRSTTFKRYAGRGASTGADRELIRMQHFDELSHVEIAGELKIPLGTVKSRTFRAHRRLAELLAHLRTDPEDSTPGASGSVAIPEGGSDV